MNINNRQKKCLKSDIMYKQPISIRYLLVLRTALHYLYVTPYVVSIYEIIWAWGFAVCELLIGNIRF